MYVPQVSLIVKNKPLHRSSSTTAVVTRVQSVQCTAYYVACRLIRRRVVCMCVSGSPTWVRLLAKTYEELLRGSSVHSGLPVDRIREAEDNYIHRTRHANSIKIIKAKHPPPLTAVDHHRSGPESSTNSGST